MVSMHFIATPRFFIEYLILLKMTGLFLNNKRFPFLNSVNENRLIILPHVNRALSVKGGFYTKLPFNANCPQPSKLKHFAQG